MLVQALMCLKDGENNVNLCISELKVEWNYFLGALTWQFAHNRNILPFLGNV